VIFDMAAPLAENFMSIVKEKPFGEVTVTCFTAPFLIPLHLAFDFLASTLSAV